MKRLLTWLRHLYRGAPNEAKNFQRMCAALNPRDNPRNPRMWE